MKVTTTPFNKLLYISPGGIGNLVMAIPALRAIRAAQPRVAITLLTAESGVHRILDHEGLIDDVLLLERKAAALWTLVKEIRGRKFAAALTAGTVNPLSAGALMLAGGIPVRVGESIGGQGFLYTVKVPYADRCHERDGALNIIEALGIEPVSLWPDLRFTPEEKRAAEVFLISHGWQPGQDLVGMHPGSSVNGAVPKRWPKENFVDVIRQYHQQKVKVLLVTGPAELALGKEIEAAAGGPLINTQAELSLRETAAAIEYCRVFLSNDSGIAHVTAAVGTPLVVLFGPTDPARVAPKGKQVIVLQTLRSGPVDSIMVRPVVDALNVFFHPQNGTGGSG